VHSPVPGRFLDVPDETEREASVAANLRYFELMRACGVAEIVIHPISAYLYGSEEEVQAARSRIADSLGRLADRAGEVGLRLAVENLVCSPDEQAIRWLGGSTASLLELIADLGDHVGICQDIGHTALAGLDPVAEWRTAASAGKAFSLHLHDVTAQNRDHYIPGEGGLDFEAFLSEVDAAGFTGGRVLEISPGRPEGATASDVRGRLRQVSAVRREWEARGEER